MACHEWAKLAQPITLKLYSNCKEYPDIFFWLIEEWWVVSERLGFMIFICSSEFEKEEGCLQLTER